MADVHQTHKAIKVSLRVLRRNTDYGHFLPAYLWSHPCYRISCKFRLRFVKITVLCLISAQLPLGLCELRDGTAVLRVALLKAERRLVLEWTNCTVIWLDTADTHLQVQRWKSREQISASQNISVKKNQAITHTHTQSYKFLQLTKNKHVMQSASLNK